MGMVLCINITITIILHLAGTKTRYVCKFSLKHVLSYAAFDETFCLRPCIHRLFPCDLFSRAVVTRSDDGGRNHTTEQQHYDPDANWLMAL